MTLSGVEHEVCVRADVVNYGPGTSRKANIINQFSGGTPTSVTPTSLKGVRITGCQFDNGGSRSFKIKYAASAKAKINGTTATAGKAPKVTCNAKRGNGKRPPENFDTFTLD
ncbi:MAG: hypothetical protein AAGH19_08370 [Pseudomonadota bacterium]